MNNNNKTAKVAAIGLISFVVYNLVYFIWFGFADHTATFWVSWVSMLVAFCSLALTTLKMGESGMFMRDWLFGYPIYKHSIIYGVVTLVVSTVFSVLDDAVKWTYAFVPLMLIFAAHIVFVISGFLAKDTIQQINTQVKDKTRFIKLLRADTELMASKCTDQALKQKCVEFAESVRFSDPMSSEALFELEKELAYTISMCDKAIVSNDYGMAEKLLARASILLEERNKKCKALK